MNFFGHLYMAAWHGALGGAGFAAGVPRDAAAYGFGAMLPDFAGIVRARVAHVSDAPLAAGVALHHAVDDAFHGADAFIGLCAAAHEALTVSGVEHGHARAIAHIGTEMMLDACLIEEPRSAALYLAALEAAPALLDAVRTHGERQRLDAFVLRIRGYGLPVGYRDDAFVAARIQDALAPRPRLALTAAEIAVLRPWIAAHRPLVAAKKLALSDELSAKLPRLA